MTHHAIFQEDLDLILRRTERHWNKFRSARIFITGGTGFVGKWLLESFLYANDQLRLDAAAVVLSRNPIEFANEYPYLANHPAIMMWEGDIRHFSFPQGVFTHVIHGATDVATTLTPLDMFDVAVAGTRRVLDFCREKNIPDLLLISSGAVYGVQPPGLDLIGEEYPGAPITTKTQSAYGEGKRAAEWLAVAYGASGGASVRIARCFAFVGPYLPLNSHFAIGNFIGDFLSGRPIEVKGDGTTMRSYMYAADMAQWLWVILAEGLPGEAYNVGAEEAISIADLAQRISVSESRSVPVKIACLPNNHKLIPNRYVPDTRKARESLGLGISTSLGSALSRTLAWIKASQGGCQ